MKENLISELLHSKTIEDIILFQVNENYFKIPEKQEWIIDGGIEFTFADTHFTIGWNQEKAHFVYDNKPFKKVYLDSNFTILSEENNVLLDTLKGNQISNIEYIWKTFDVIQDYTMNVIKEKHIVGLKIHFNTHDYVIVSAINYELEKNKAPKNFRYSINNELLISLNAIPQILD